MHGSEDVTEEEREALHRIELGVEWLRRAHGNLVAFHHNTGHAMDHLAEAEQLLRATDRDSLADELRDEHLPLGVVRENGERWSYDLLEDFESGFLASVTGFERAAREEIADGRRHLTERGQEREWKRRARR
ncbi:hypothetical protein BRC94_04075 [Halobacteriales archaeon QS_5_70_17]|nr:MAG: hypothetical protein BRC94_04075 [Halobacteriales archaeon QS_5_70_17]